MFVLYLMASSRNKAEQMSLQCVYSRNFNADIPHLQSYSILQDCLFKPWIPTHTVPRILLFSHLLTRTPTHPPSSGGWRSSWGYYLDNWRSLLKHADEAGWDGEEWKWKRKTDQIPNYPPLFSHSFFLALTGLESYSGGSFYCSCWPWT